MATTSNTSNKGTAQKGSEGSSQRGFASMPQDKREDTDRKGGEAGAKQEGSKGVADLGRKARESRTQSEGKFSPSTNQDDDED